MNRLKLIWRKDLSVIVCLALCACFYSPELKGQFAIQEAPCHCPEILFKGAEIELNVVTSVSTGDRKGVALVLTGIEDNEVVLIDNPGIDSLRVYWVDEYTGYLDSLMMREFELYSSEQSQKGAFSWRREGIDQFFVSVWSVENIVLDLSVVDESRLSVLIRDRGHYVGIYIGLMLAMFVYNVFVGVSVRERVYLYYSGYVFFVALTQAVIHGYVYLYIGDELGFYSYKMLYLFGSLSGLFTLLFVTEFLKLRQTAPVWARVLMVIAAIDFVALLLALVGLERVSYNIIDGCAGGGSILVLLVAVLLVFRRVPSAKFFLIAWSLFLLSVLVFVLNDAGFLSRFVFTKYSMLFGSGVEVLLLSLALANRINVLTAEKKSSQQRALEVSRENERIIREQNLLLEEKVTERTSELEQSNRDLNDTLVSLQMTQAQLVEAEKMASLGQMTAGIAHELNNPINYVSSNIEPLRRDVHEVFDVLDGYKHFADTQSEAALDAARSLEDDIDLPFVKNEIGQLMSGIEEGAHRSAAIVRGLRIFSRLDEDTLKMANVNDGIESTLVILKSNYKEQCEVLRSLDEGLPDIECYPGKLNQVFMNMLTNAIQAVAERHDTSAERKVKIQTQTFDKHIEVLISDNGAGIPKDKQPRIFEPFFTTKKVGEGTGLGLSIVLGIIEQHKGEITLESEEGVGTTFRIRLPFRISQDRAE